MLFLDEIHRMSRPAEEMLYLAMEDFRVDVIVGKGPGATAIPLELPPFTVVGRHDPGRAAAGAAARPVRLHRPPRLLRHRRPRHDPAPLGPAARRRRRRRRASPRSPGGPAAHPASPTGCCAGSATGPRCTAQGVVDQEAAHAALALFDVDERGLDRLDRAVLEALCRRFGGGPVGPDDAGRRRGRGVRHRRDRGRAVPRARGLHGPHAARPGRRAAGLGAPRPDAAVAGGRNLHRPRCRWEGGDGRFGG